MVRDGDNLGVVLLLLCACNAYLVAIMLNMYDPLAMHSSFL